MGGNGPPGACGGNHRDDLGLRGCAVGMCRRRLRSWLINTHNNSNNINNYYYTCNRNHDDGPVASLAWLLLITCRAVSAVGGSGLWQARSGASRAPPPGLQVLLGQPWWVVGRCPWPSSAQCHGGGLKRSKLASPGDSEPRSIMLQAPTAH